MISNTELRSTEETKSKRIINQTRYSIILYVYVLYSTRAHTNYTTKVQRDNSKDMTVLWFETMSYFTTYTSLCIVMYTHTQIYVYSYNIYYIYGSCNSQTKATTGERNNNFPTNKIEIGLVST